MFEITLGLTVIVFLFWCIYGFIIGYEFFVQTVYTSGVFIYSILYILQKKGIRFRLLTQIYYYLVLFLLGISWLPSGGIKAAIPTFLALVYLSGLLVLPLKDYLIFIIVTFGLVFGLTLFEIQNPELVGIYDSNELLMQDLAIATLISLVIMGICLFAFKRTYIDDRRELRERNRELMREKRSAETTDQAKTTFLATISHEMRTPLNGIVGMTELLSKTEINDEQKELIESLVFSSNILHGLISNVLDITTIEAGKLKLQISSFSIRNELQGIWQVFKKKTESNSHLEIKMDLDNNLPEFLKGDMARIRQVLVNLMNNAIKFTYKGSITLKVNVLGQVGDVASVQFVIVDTGAGIPLEKQPHLFETFYKGTDEDGYEGTGLGLSIVEKLVKLMGGTIDFQSTPSEGSSFFFTLPLGVANTEHTNEMDSIDVPGLSELKMLIVEDVEINRLVASKMLKSMNISDIDIAVNGTEGVEKATNKRYDIILMDLQMPDISGFEASKQIAAYYEEAVRKPTIIALTANAMKGSMEECLEAGMSDYVLKPIKTDTLKNVLIKHLNEIT
ncbi:ATP-binding protein [Ekhidna sp. To15]|uniref:ATP-binding protein n=1 Tax=Ekhidna sp. To15 TaxID=3395267 RepID=UPI003F523C3A